MQFPQTNKTAPSLTNRVLSVRQKLIEHLIALKLHMCHGYSKFPSFLLGSEKVRKYIFLADQYADGRAAKVWEIYVGDKNSRTDHYKTFLINLLRGKKCRNVLDVACGTG
jgi:hypothetical protein